MRTSVIISLFAATLLAATATASYAQNSAVDQEKGSTGWSGGSKDQPSQSPTGQKTVVHDEALSKNQPVMATGEDLKGKPTQFAPSKTPE